MNLNFDFGNIRVTEFGVGADDGGGRTFSLVQVDGGVQDALREMAEATWQAMQGCTGEPEQYEPSEKYGSIDYVYSPLDDALSEPLTELHRANNLPMDVAALNDPSAVFCYFARFIGRGGQRLTAVRRAAQFKGVLRGPLIVFQADALRIIPDKIFKLDTDFDLLIDNDNIHILRPSGFESVGQLRDAVLEAVPTNIAAIAQDMPFVDFTGIEAYASTHPRAARYLASIRSRRETQDIDRGRLAALCQRTGVSIEEADGNISVSDGHVIGFLEVLDRRRYELELVAQTPESYRAPSRQRLNAPARDRTGDG